MHRFFPLHGDRKFPRVVVELPSNSSLNEHKRERALARRFSRCPLRGGCLVLRRVGIKLIRVAYNGNPGAVAQQQGELIQIFRLHLDVTSSLDALGRIHEDDSI